MRGWLWGVGRVQLRHHPPHGIPELPGQGALQTQVQLSRFVTRFLWASQEGLMVRACRRPKEMRVRSLAWEDPLEEGMATYSRLFAWRMPWIEEPGGLQSLGLQRVRHD